MQTRPLTGELLALDNEMNVHSLKLNRSKKILVVVLELMY